MHLLHLGTRGTGVSAFRQILASSEDYIDGVNVTSVLLSRFSNCRPKKEGKSMSSSGDPFRSSSQFCRAISAAAAQAAFCIIDSGQTQTNDFGAKLSKAVTRELRMDCGGGKDESKGVLQTLVSGSDTSGQSRRTGIYLGQSHPPSQADAANFPICKRQRWDTVSEASYSRGSGSNRLKDYTQNRQTQDIVLNKDSSSQKTKTRRRGTFRRIVAIRAVLPLLQRQ